MIGLILYITFSVVAAQTISIIDAQTNTPIPNVNVYADSVGVITDNYGFCSLNTFKQNDQITFAMIGYKTITLPYNRMPKMIYLEKESIPMELVSVFGKNKKSKKRYTRLEKNVRKVYPYALKISDMLIDYSAIMDSLEQYSGLIKYKKKRDIFSKIEDELIYKYGYSIKKLRKSQGRILIRLVDRETSKTSFDIIKDFRNVFSAGFWQLTAKIFGHNLRSAYNPNKGEDRMIEYIINRIENEKRKS